MAEYAYKWAMEVVQKLLDSSPRVGLIVRRALGITPQNLAEWLAKKDPRWEIFKKVMKRAEKVGARFPKGTWEPEDYSTFVQQAIHLEDINVAQPDFGGLAARSCAYYARRAQNREKSSSEARSMRSGNG